jgi:archaellum component FlaG (FlaF/FlaG flagellin family)
MGSVAMSEGIMLIASITVAAGISVVVLNQMGVLQSSIVQTSSREKEVTLTKIKTLYVANTSSTTFSVWAKNVGSADINSLDRMDLYFGKVGSARQISHNSGSAPSWTLNDSSIKSWRIMDTLQINVTTDTPLESNTTYFVRIVTPNGISDDYVFSVS